MNARRQPSPLLLLTYGGMELSWRYVWAFFLCLAAVGTPFPIPAALCTFTTAAALSHLTARENLRRYQSIGIQSTGFILCAFVTLYPGHFQGVSFFSLEWISGLLSEPKGIRQWFKLGLLLLCQLLIWRGGRRLIKGSKNYKDICLQFDKGLGLLFALLIVKSLVEVKGGLIFQVPAMGIAALAFLIFSLISIGLARNRNQAEKSFLEGYHVLGLFLSISTITVFLIAGVTFLAFPSLYHLADMLLNSIEQVSGPAIPVLISILLFFLKPKKVLESSPPPKDGAPDLVDLPITPAGSEETLVVAVLGSGLMVALALASVGILVLLLKIAFTWLLKTNAQPGTVPVSKNWFSTWLKTLAFFPLWVFSVLVSRLKGIHSAAMVFAMMVRWGRRSGLTLKPSETPAEYGEKLQNHFPQLQDEICLIVEAFNREYYGQMKTSGKELSKIKAARRSMQRIKHWTGRIKIWLRI